MPRKILSQREQFSWRLAEVQENPRLEDSGTPDYGNGRWIYPHREFRPNKSYPDEGMHTWGIEPTSAPAVHEYEQLGKSGRIFYDPARASIGPPGDFRPQVVHRPGAITDFHNIPDPGGMLWRGMSDEEYQQAKRRGYFESNNSYNLFGDDPNAYQRGKTFYSTTPDHAAHYATGFAPWQYQPTFDHPAHLIGILDRPEVPRGPSGKEPSSYEVGVPGRVPFNSMIQHWVGNVAAIHPGEVNNSIHYGDWDTPTRGLSPRSEVQWEKSQA